ncbi:MAG TPA: TRAP transporter substrate-binding protein, partial [Chloroflexota bacterium]|nr:TRAP transporter substrate-binding protein [Chloroflexota bacterium]
MRGHSSISRRDFLRMVGLGSGAIALGGVATACSSPAAPAAPTKAAAPAATSAPAQPTLAAPAAAVKGKTVRVAYSHGAGGTSEKAANDLVKYIADQTKGEYTVQVFPGGQLGGERDMAESQQMGSIEIGWFGTFLIDNIVSEWGSIVDTPYVMRDVTHFRKVVDGSLFKPVYDAILQRKGIRHIAWSNRGPRYLTSNKPVKTPADVKGMKIRVPEYETYVAAWKMLGATVVPMAFPEVFMALKQGTIDAQENPLENAVNGSFYDVQKFVNLTGHIVSGYQLTVSDKWFQTLTPQLQKTFTDGIVMLCENQTKYQMEDEAKLTQTLKDKGMTFNEVDKASFQNAVKDLPKQFTGKWEAG